MPLQATSGAASYDAFGGGVAVVPNYIEDVFSTYLYIGAGATQTITNGIDLSGKGGLVWTKARSSVSGAPTYYTHELTDTVRGANNGLTTSTTAPQSSSDVNGFTSTGFNLTVSTGRGNAYDINEVSWTFREQPKFFDVQTWTGDGTSYRDIAHSLNSVPACMIVKVTSTTGDWFVYHKNLASDQYYLKLNTTAAQSSASSPFDLPPTSTVFTVGYNGVNSLNTSGATYVAYLFAHNAGGFGLTGTDNVISCGSFVTDGSGNATVNLGYEPQWLLTKQSSGGGGQDWYLVDNMRPWSLDTGTDGALRPNLANAEYVGDYGFPTATGFYQTGLNASATHIYIAIRRGPMKVPTVGTSVFSPSYGLSASNSEFVNAGFPIDLNWRGKTTGDNNILQDRLRGASQLLFGNLTSAESTSSAYVFTTQNGCTFTSTANFSPWINWSFRRAPSFFDVVCYTGTGSATTVTHNLQAVPQLIICKRRTTNGYEWLTYCAFLNGGVTPQNWWIRINSSSQQFDSNAYWNDTSPTASVFSVGVESDVNTNGASYVAYLFATCAGVSKVGGYTGNGSSQTINCGFTSGARFVLIKRTDSTGDWMVSDSARGIIAGSDPYLELNNTNAEVTGEDWLDTDSTGFVVNEVSGSNANTSSATYIFLAIA